MECYKNEDDIILSPLLQTVMSIQGKFTNLFISEDDVCFYLPKGNILGAESNYGEVWADKYNGSKLKKKKSNRGRKKKVKKTSKRKKQGNGRHLNSQITFHGRSHLNKNKIYKIKCFRTETFNVPGILKKDMSDVLPILYELRDYHREMNLCDDIKISDIHPFLINYKCRIVNTNLLIELQAVIDLLTEMKKDPHDKKKIYGYMKKSNNITPKMRNIINKYIPINRFDIAELKYEAERFPSGITIKFWRPSLRIKKPKDLHARSTIKVFKSNKFNLDAVKSEQEVYDLYIWLNDLFSTYKSRIIFDLSKDSDSSSSEYDSDSEFE
jgi:hypothetical protein